LVIFARSCTGLKNFARYARKTVRDPTVIVPARIRSVPRQSTMDVQQATTTAMTGERSDLMRRALSAAFTVERRFAEPRRPTPCAPKAPYGAHGFEPGRKHGDDVAFTAPHPRWPLTALLSAPRTAAGMA
jgi:hypothetical protein